MSVFGHHHAYECSKYTALKKVAHAALHVEGKYIAIYTKGAWYTFHHTTSAHIALLINPHLRIKRHTHVCIGIPTYTRI